MSTNGSADDHKGSGSAGRPRGVESEDGDGYHRCMCCSVIWYRTVFLAPIIIGLLAIAYGYGEGVFEPPSGNVLNFAAWMVAALFLLPPARTWRLREDRSNV